VAEFLDMPHVTHVDRVDMVDDVTLRVGCRIEPGHMDLEVKMPVVLAVEKGINEPRAPSIWGAVWIQEKRLTTWSASDIGVDQSRTGLAGSRTMVSGVTMVEMGRKGETLNGTPSGVARELVRKLKAEGVLTSG
jgi:electron transfer flavoprotein beta subunit